MDAVSGPIALGQLIVRRGLLTEEQLELAVAEHLASGRRLGEILIERGYLDERELASVLDEQLASLTSQPADGARGIGLLHERLAAAEAELERETAQGVAVEDGRDAAPVERAELRSVPDPVDGFVLFVPTPGGYQLLERAGQPPPVGGGLGTSGGELVVLKVGASPLPGDPRPCVFLQER